MTAFDEAFTVLRVEHAFDLMQGQLLQKGKMEDAMELQRMREFVNVNAESADPAKREAAQQMLQHLTEIMSNRRPMPEGMPQMPIGEGGVPSASAEHPALEKAFDFLKKNVVGMQAPGEGQAPVQYSMPPSVASMAQRPQVPETVNQTMESQAPGMFGRFKPPVQQSVQIPTGQMNMGGPQTFVPQQNAENPMAGMGGMGQMMSAPGAAVERMPRPSPFRNPKYAPNESFAGQGYTVDDAGEYVRPENPYQGRQARERFENKFKLPVGQDEYAGVTTANTANAQQGAADQFSPFNY